MLKPRIFNIKLNKDLRKDLRVYSTQAEKIMWSNLKNRSFNNLKFRRQHGIGNYIVDLYCAEQNLVIELDGDTHQEVDIKNNDKIRTAFLEGQGLKVLRFTNIEVFRNVRKVLQDIEKSLDLHSNSGINLPPTPSFPRRGS
ncbi:hypothetical protein BH10BAC5_BH10BAC5_12940 [soil metagenome]